ncbi:TetR/AcrR family transcriptional regulator [Nocardia sp. NBC_01503]|uniref:TetR/AcrR family transcriptional regulator n=1 Tax=Nocardia sp. NBC_01503 TaxID=2975997 RepID=UPI002E7BAA4F|nr:helix-turn-helix domain-containing protein [Nocardia sp. NBC_01503]WTL33159.1 TetR/AcrR family transcriptional regulator [Nocardia sp. NBC_01503]
MTERPLRADARRNRERVLAAAQEAFAAEGISVPLDEIARRAGVGAGTVYRHFPTKEALFAAAIVDRVDRMTGRAREGLAGADPGAAFFAFLRQMDSGGGVKRDLADALGPQGAHTYEGPTRELQAAIGELLSRAQRAGAVRPDIGIDDLLSILKGFFIAVHMDGMDSARRERTFAVILDGLRI